MSATTAPQPVVTCSWCGRPLKRPRPQYAHAERHYCKLVNCQREYKRWLYERQKERANG